MVCLPVLLFLTLLDCLPLALPPAEGLLGDEQPSVKILLSFATSCTAAVMGWSQLLANWIGDGHCAGGGSPCTLMKRPVLSHDGMRRWSAMCGSHGAVWKYCPPQHLRGSSCRKAWSDTQAEL